MANSQSSTRVCLGCGKMEPRPSHSKPWFTCNKECFLAHRREKWRKAHPIDESPISCKMCGKEFVPNPLIRYKAKYCSEPCKRKGYKAIYKRWIATHREEHKVKMREQNIKKKWGGNHLAALERDGRRCQICGTDTRLLVHHLDNEGEKRGKNHRLDNLLTLCWGCHKAIHGVSIIKSNGGWVAKGRILACWELPRLKLFRNAFFGVRMINRNSG